MTTHMSNTVVEESKCEGCIKYYYYTFTNGLNIFSWRVERLKYNLDSPRELIAFIIEQEKQYPNFYLTWWKELGDSE